MPQQKSIFNIASFIQQLLFRTRPTERLTEALTLQDLQKISRYDGTLPYTDTRVRALVWEVKYYKESRATKLAGAYLAELLLAEASDTVGTPLLIPMPMHPKRRRERGHNQTEVLCESALSALGVAKRQGKNSLARRLSDDSRGRPEDFFEVPFCYAPQLLIRTRHTAPQQGLERHNRLHNVQNAMAVADPAKVKSRVCIVVDDVTTTGASFAEAKRALKEVGASEVRCIALAQS